MEANADRAELDKFGAMPWWDRQGPCKPLHDINPLRLRFIHRRVDLQGQRALDVGCGGGILSEALARAGAVVTAIDLAEDALAAAREHAGAAGLSIDYRQISTEALADSEPAAFDVVTCLEMLEHVPDPAAVCEALGRLVRPGGEVFLSTLNRNPKSWLHAIVGAEYVLQMLPRGTHEHARFIRPSELAAMCRQAGLVVEEMAGIGYNPLTGRYALNDDVSVNYLVRARRPD